MRKRKKGRGRWNERRREARSIFYHGRFICVDHSLCVTALTSCCICLYCTGKYSVAVYTQYWVIWPEEKWGCPFYWDALRNLSEIFFFPIVPAEYSSFLNLAFLLPVSLPCTPEIWSSFQRWSSSSPFEKGFFLISQVLLFNKITANAGKAFAVSSDVSFAHFPRKRRSFRPSLKPYQSIIATCFTWACTWTSAGKIQLVQNTEA